MGLHVANADISHAAVLVALYGQCFDDPWSMQSMAAVLASPGAFAVIAAEGVRGSDAPVGFALARHAGDEVELISLGVLPSHRRRGIAAMLLGDVMRRGRAAGATRLMLEVAETNDAARALYAAHGFLAVGRRPDYYQRANMVPVAALTLSCDLAGAPSAGEARKSIKNKS